MNKPKGLSVRLKLTLSYVGFLVLAGALLLTAVWVFLLRYVPEGNIDSARGFVPNRSDLLDAFGPAATGVLLFLLVFGLIGGWFLAGRMLAPLDRITQTTRVVAEGDLARRIHLPGRNDEFGELAEAFDNMLDEVEAHVAEQQRFAANASHELRTPLAITQTLLDVAGKETDIDTGELLQRLGTVNKRAIELTESLLWLARAGRKSFTPEIVDLSLLVEEATETLLPLAEKRLAGLEVASEVATTHGSPPLLQQLIINLIHNAIVHNLPENGTVWISTGNAAGKGILTVENTGEHLPPALVNTLTEPFQRSAKRARSDDEAGAGLGLAIAASIVKAHHGSLSLTARTSGGLRIVVELPD